MNTPRALIAARKSTKPRVAKGQSPSARQPQEGQSLHTQDEYSRRFCEHLGWQVAGVAKDTISGRVAPIDRKELGSWLAEPTRFDLVVAYRSDRLSRGDQEDWTRIEHWATEHRKTLVMVDSATGVRYPARDDSDYWQWQAAKRQAGREWDEIRERSLRFQDALVRKGAFLGRPPWGYEIVGDYYSKRLEPLAADALLIRQIFARVTAGESLDSVAAWLTTQGRTADQTFIGRVIMNWKYAGRMERNGQHYGDCTPIVTADELAAAQRAMKSRATKRGGRPPKDEPPLMVMTCGLEGCGKRMYRAGGRGGYRYWCIGAHKFSLPAELAERAVRRIVETSTEPEMVVEIVRGRSFKGDVERLKRDRRQALEREDIEAVVEISKTIQELEARDDEPDHPEPKPTGRTIGQAYAALTRDELRVKLRQWEIIAYPDGRLRAEAPWKNLQA